MSTRLDRALQGLHPSRIIDPTQQSVDEALNSFRAPVAPIQDRHEFKRILASLFAHIDSHILGLRPPRKPNFKMDYSRACQLLAKKYGDNAWYVAFEKSRHGHDGGLFGVTRDLAAVMAEDNIQNMINISVNMFWQECTPDQRLQVPREYLQKWGRFLPSDVTEGSAGRLMAFFPEYMKQHPFLMKGLRGVGNNA